MKLLRAFDISILFLAAPLFIVAAGAAQITASEATVKTAAATQKPGDMSMPMNTSLVAPLVIDSADWSSVLTLVNESKASAHARISLHSAGGNEAIPITQMLELPGHSSVRMSIQTLLAGREMDFWGSLTVDVQEPKIAKNMAVAAQLTLIGRGNLTGQSADEELVIPMAGGSLKAVAWSQKTLIAIRNAGMQLAHATISCVDHGNLHQSTLSIAAGETQLLQGCKTDDVRSALPDLSSAATVEQRRAEVLDPDHGLAYQVSSASSELAVYGLSLSFKRQSFHATPVIFTHQNEFTSQSTVFAGIPIGLYEPLPGVVLTPELVLANFTLVTHHVAVRGVLSGTPAAPTLLASVSLDPREVKRIEVPFNTSGDPEIASLIIEQDGSPGEVVSSLFDRDSFGETSLVPLPKFRDHANNGGGHPWILERGVSSSLLLFNATTKSEIVNLNLGTDGVVWHDTVTMNPYESRTISLSDLIASANESDADKKHADPKITARYGEISWFTPGQTDVFGRVLIARQQNGGRALESYSCGYNIVMCGSYLAGAATATFAVGSTGALGPIAAQTCTSYDPNACSGQSYGTASGYSYNWSSNNTNIATISGSSTNPSGTFLGKSGGTAIGQGVVANGTGCAFVADGVLKVQVPTASRITKNINNQSSLGTPYCKAGVNGWLRVVNKIVTDQNNTDMVVGGQALTEQVTLPQPNVFGIPNAKTGTANTNAQGLFSDTFYLCSSLCPSSTSKLGATQTIFDTLNGTNYTLTNNSIVYSCSSISVNGQ